MSAIYLSENFDPPRDPATGSMTFRCPYPDCGHQREYHVKASLMHGIVDHFILAHKTRVFFGGPRERQTTLSELREKFRRELARERRRC